MGLDDVSFSLFVSARLNGWTVNPGSKYILAQDHHDNGKLLSVSIKDGYYSASFSGGVDCDTNISIGGKPALFLCAFLDYELMFHCFLFSGMTAIHTHIDIRHFPTCLPIPFACNSYG